MMGTFFIFFLFSLSYCQRAVPPLSHQFQEVGLLTKAYLDPRCNTTAIASCGGTIQVNGKNITVPSNLMVVLPANYLTFGELFLDPFNGTVKNETGLALEDLPVNKLAAGCTFEVTVDGSRVFVDATSDRMIAGLISIAQNSLVTSTGIITGFDWNLGFILVKVGETITRVQINDPTGNFDYHQLSPDPRYTIDPDNPTIAAVTAYPMCFPCRRDIFDAACEIKCRTLNRPKDANGVPLLSFTVVSAVQSAPTPTSFGVSVRSTTGMSPYAAAPFMENDLISVSGIIIRDAVGYFISAHEVTANTGIYTATNMEPSYIAVDGGLMGVGGPVLDGTEAADRTRFEGSCTDAGRVIYVYGKEFGTGAEEGNIFFREWGQVRSFPTTNVPPGRWRLRPDCEVAIPTDRDCVMPTQGFYYPAVREVEARTRRVINTDTQYNGIVYSRYASPIGEYIFPEPRDGTPVLVENDFTPFLFLTQGGQESGNGYVNGQLNPWPGLSVPPLCSTTIFPAATNILAATTSLAPNSRIPLRVQLTNGRMISFDWTNTNSITAPNDNLICRRSSNPIFQVPAQVISGQISVNAQRICGRAVTSRNYSPGTTAPATAVLITSAVYRAQKATLTITLAAGVVGTGTTNFFSLMPFEVNVNSRGSCFDPNPLMTGNEQSFVQSGNWPLNTRTITLTTPIPLNTLTVVRSSGGYWASGTSNPTFISMHTVTVTIN